MFLVKFQSCSIILGSGTDGGWHGLVHVYDWILMSYVPLSWQFTFSSSTMLELIDFDKSDFEMTFLPGNMQENLRRKSQF